MDRNGVVLFLKHTLFMSNNQFVWQLVSRPCPVLTVLFVHLSESDLANLGQLYRDERLKQKAETMKLDHCEKLHRFVGRQRGN